MYETLHGMKKGLKDIVAPQGMFEDLGLKYLGPVDGHDERAVEVALRRARLRRPGAGARHHAEGPWLRPRQNHEADQFHAVGVINPGSLPLEISGRSWTDEFSDEMVAIGAEREDVVGITAAMLIRWGSATSRRPTPTGSSTSASPSSTTTMAAGMAFGGLHPSSPSMRPSSTGLRPAADGLRAAPGRCDLRARPLRASPAPTARPPRDVGHDPHRHGPGLHLAAPRDGEQVRPRCARPSTSRTRPA